MIPSQWGRLTSLSFIVESFLSLSFPWWMWTLNTPLVFSSISSFHWVLFGGEIPSNQREKSNLQKGCWQYNEGRTVSGVWIWLVDRHEGNHLHGLPAVMILGPLKPREGEHPQAHFIGQNTAPELGFALLAHHPTHANDLMREEPHLHTGKEVVYTKGSSQKPL